MSEFFGAQVKAQLTFSAVFIVAKFAPEDRVARFSDFCDQISGQIILVTLPSDSQADFAPGKFNFGSVTIFIKMFPENRL